MELYTACGPIAVSSSVATTLLEHLAVQMAVQINALDQKDSLHKPFHHRNGNPFQQQNSRWSPG